MLDVPPGSASLSDFNITFDPNFAFGPHYPDEFDFGSNFGSDFDPNLGLSLDFSGLSATASQPETLNQRVDYNTSSGDDHGTEGQEPEDEAENILADTTIRPFEETSSSTIPYQPGGAAFQHRASTSNASFPPPATMHLPPHRVTHPLPPTMVNLSSQELTLPPTPQHSPYAAMPPPSMPLSYAVTQPPHHAMPFPQPTTNVQPPVAIPAETLELERRLTMPTHTVSQRDHPIIQCLMF
jgi:hypothetical protein